MRPYLPQYCLISTLLVFFSASAQAIPTESDTVLAVSLYQAGQRYSTASQFDSAIIAYSKAAAIWKSVGNEDKVVLYQYELAKSHIQKGELDAALILLKDSEERLHRSSLTIPSGSGITYTLIGYILNAKEEYDKSIAYTKLGIEYNRLAFGERDERVASGYYTLGLAYKAKGDYDRALENLTKATELQKELFGETYHFLPTMYTMLGSLCNNKNQYGQALENFNRSLALLSDLKRSNSADAALCYLNMMSAYDGMGEYPRAIECGKQSVRLYEALSLADHPNVASAYGKLGEIYTAMGDFAKAKEYLERSLDMFRHNYPDRVSAAGILYQFLGDVYRQTGDLSKALQYSTDGVALIERSASKDNPDIGYLYKQLGDVYADLKKYPNALSNYQKALASRSQVSSIASRNDISSIYSSIGCVYIDIKDWANAERFLNLAATVDAESHGAPLQTAVTFGRIGDLYAAQRQALKALTYYHKAAAALSEQESATDPLSPPVCGTSMYKKELLDIVVSKAKMLEALYRSSRKVSYLTASLRHYRTAMDLVDDIRKLYTADASKLRLVEKSQSVYTNACRIALDLAKQTGDRKYERTALLIADRNKANIILEKLFDGEAKHYADIPDSLLDREKELLRHISYVETEIYRHGKGENSNAQNGTLAPLRERLFALKAEHQRLVDLFEKQYPKYYQLKYSAYALSVRDIQSSLDGSTAMVEYLIDNDDVHIFFVSSDTLIVRTVRGAADVNNAIEAFVSTLKKYETRDYPAAGYALYAKVLGPVATAARSYEKLIIIPDGNLYYVPFEALLTRPMKGTVTADFTQLPYLIRQKEISYSYSAQFYRTVNAGTRNGNSSVSSFIGFAPVFADSSKNGDFLANRSFAEESGLTDVRAITMDGKTFNELKYSEDEIESISRSFTQHDLSSRSFLFTAATETNFKRYCSQYDVIHVATHGFINENNPKFSAILFSQPSSQTPDDDGILYVDETFNLDLKAKLVVLSSCESGLGKLVQGEGMIALTRGLFYSGAKNIVFSLWKVSDKQTYLLMDRFYQDMLSGRSYSSSLRQAKLQMIASKESAFPSKWSGFVLVGN